MTPLLAVTAGAALGAASGFHCIAMCGPLAATACSKREGGVDEGSTAQYLAGRALGYSAVGAIAGAMGAPIASGTSGGVLRLIVAALVAGVLATRAIAWLRPAKAARSLIPLRLRKPGRAASAAFARILPFLPRRGLGLGLATAIFPCGALFGGVVAAAGAGSSGLGALTMLAFALGSAPLLMVPALVGARIPERLREGWGKKAAAVVLLAIAAWVVATPVVALAKPAPQKSCCAHQHG